MNDMSSVIIAKSDQLNADDLLGGPRTVVISRVSITPGEQPVTISFDGDNGRPYKPCKSMCRVMVALWGADANAYVGRSMTLYRDPEVKWGGLEVGGIRISHMSDITGKAMMALTQTRGNKKPFTVLPMARPATPTLREAREAMVAAFAGLGVTEEQLEARGGSVADLRVLYAALKDGTTTVAREFPSVATPDDVSRETLDPRDAINAEADRAVEAARQAGWPGPNLPAREA
jgi:hypothetical protein